MSLVKGIARGLSRGLARGLFDSGRAEDLYVNSRAELEALLLANGVASGDIESTIDAIWPVMIDPDTGVEYANYAAFDNQIYNQGGILKADIVAAIPSTPSNGLLANLVSYWNKDEGSGLTRVDSENAYNAINNGTVGAVAGKSGNAAAFDGNSSNFLSVASNSDLQIGNRSSSFSFWFNLNDVTTSQVLISRRGSSSANREFYVRVSDGVIRLYWYVDSSGGNTNLVSSVPILINTTYHGTITMDQPGGEIAISINGTRDSKAVSTSNAGSAPLVFGALDTTGFNPMNGWIDEVAYHHQAYTQTDIDNLYNSGAGLFRADYN